MNSSPSNLAAEPGTVTVIGAGNIGSQLLALIARMPAVVGVTIVDHDSYEERNVVSQAITPEDAGQPKAVVQAAKLRKINPRLQVTALVDRVENVPASALRATVAAGCLDSPVPRRIVNRIAWKLGVPFVDAGVHGDGMLARIRVYRPDPAGPCLECLWDDADYLTEQESYTCDGTRLPSPPTHAPASLGALAAAMQAIELEKILSDQWERVAVGREVLHDASFHRHVVTQLRRHAGCRFDHRTISLHAFHGAPDRLTLAELFGSASGELRVEGQAFANRWACGICQTASKHFGLRTRLAGSVRCPKCGREMRALGFDTLDRLSEEDVPQGMMTAPLSTLGFRVGDIFSTTTVSGESHFEITLPKGDEP